MENISKLAFIVNSEKEGANELTDKLIEIAEEMGVEVKEWREMKVPNNFLKGQDVCCVIGGDGTILSAVKECLKHQVPVFGINQGKLGFLATLSAKDVGRKFRSILEGKYRVVKRFVLDCYTAEGKHTWALNDVVIKHGETSRLMELTVHSNEEFVTSYSCDGLIIATPTGSTAYNLSAGGPIIYPGANVIAMTPICPHTLTNRSVIFNKSSRIRVSLPEEESPDYPQKVQVSLDGHEPWKTRNIFPIEVEISDTTLLLLQPKDYSHFKILRSKLKWGDH